ncbi:MAG: DNA polymerase III subunit alpha, partial [Chitinophagaceae bacterium]|nr:DNA polymerase III subunit alpha [Chitinophagaceae bacterium]
MQKYMRELKPDKLEDLIALNALYRPGPIAYIPKFIARKQGKETITYDLPEMEEYLAETYGITVYQEQVMLLSQKLAGFTRGDADVLRKAMGKKQKDVLHKMKSKYLEGASQKGHPTERLEKIWTDWEAFAEYAFNKSHSTCYAVVAYQTAYLKAHYQSEFMSAVLNHQGSIDKITFFMAECKKMNITVLGPDINESLKGFSPNKKGEIRFGLGGLKGVGEAAISNIIEERLKHGNYKDIFDFITRINQRTVNKKTLESLAYSGAFDCFTALHRAQYFHVAENNTSGIEKIINYAQAKLNESASISNTLFGDLSQVMSLATPKIPDCEPWTLIDKLNYEREVVGIFLSGHPLEHFRFELNNYNILPLIEFEEIKNDIEQVNARVDKNIWIAGLITNVAHRLTKTGKNYGIFTLEDFSGKTELDVWGEDYIKMKNYLEVGKIICVIGSFKQRWQDAPIKFGVNQILLLETLKKTHTKHFCISMHSSSLTQDMLVFLETNVKQNPGATKLSFNFYIDVANDNVSTTMSYNLNNFSLNDDLIDFLMNHNEISITIK